MTRRALLAIAALGTAAAGSAQNATIGAIDNYILLSEEYGGRAYIGLPLAGRNIPDEPIEGFQPTTKSGSEIGDLFAQLCLAKPFDRSAYDVARQGVASDFRPSVRALPDFAAAKPLIGVDKVAATQIVQDHAPYGIASLWLGEGGEGLGKRQSIEYSGGLVITGPVKVKDLYAPQCNLTVRAAGLTTATGLFDRLQAALPGATAGKRSEKPKNGYASWTMPGLDGRTARVSAEASGLQKAAQTVHLTIQLLPAGKTK